MTGTPRQMRKLRPGRRCASSHLRAKNSSASSHATAREINSSANEPRSSISFGLFFSCAALVSRKGRTKLDRVAGGTDERERFEPRMQKLISDLMLELRELDTRIVAFDRVFAELSRADETMHSYCRFPGPASLTSALLEQSKRNVVVVALSRTNWRES